MTGPDPKPLKGKKPRDSAEAQKLRDDLFLYGHAFVDKRGRRIDPTLVTIQTDGRPEVRGEGLEHLPASSVFRPLGLDQLRVRDQTVLALARISGEACAACGAPPGSVHHVLQRGSPHFGDDVPGNLVLLCGSGSDRCHGAFHGSAYTIEAVLPELVDEHLVVVLERRDQAWVARRIGETLRDRRPDVIDYVLGKLGPDAGRAHLERVYHLEVP